MNPGKLFAALAVAGVVSAQDVQVVKVESKTLSRTVLLTGELLPFQAVDLHARVQGFVEKVLVDRGSIVKQGELLVTLSAPEMEAQVAEAEAKVKTAESAVSEARAKLVAAESTYKRLKEASATEGAISGNELVIAEQSAEALRDAVRASESATTAAKASLAAVQKMQQYLHILAPFSGVISERLAHPGALAGPGAGPLLRLEQVSRLRLVVAVPEANFAGVSLGAKAPFQVSAYPTRTFHGAVARIARSIDPKTRSMSVELEVSNASGALAPGMYPQVHWPVHATERALVVPSTSVVRTTERVFVIRVKDGRAEWVDVRVGARESGQFQVFGSLAEGDMVVRNGSDEIRDGSKVTVPTAKPG
ncbi:MAG: efflux RND transporter periplasmic adaptor subunit [Bryobacteraceae bacterium]|nr:efflux RND transporter periplasmic adaptor subunit [Bryobacteraceae bacterium]